MKLHRFIGLFLFLIIVLLLSAHKIKADEVRLGVSPMYFHDIKIKCGESTELSLKLANTSLYSNKTDKSKLSLYTFNVNIGLSDKNHDSYKNLSDAEQKKVLSSNWITLKENNFPLVPNQVKTLKFTVKVPKDTPEGEYIALLNVAKVPANSSTGSKEMSVSVNITSQIQVPVFITVLNSQGVSKDLFYSFKETEIGMNGNYESQSMLQLIAGLVVPGENYMKYWNRLLHQPLYITQKFRGTTTTFYDIPSVKKVPLGNVITTAKPTNTSYVVVPEGLSTELIIDKIDFEERNLILQSGGKKYTLVFPSVELLQNVQEQITNLSSTLPEGAKPSVDWLYKNTKMYSRQDYNEINMLFFCKIKNTGTKTLIPIGNIDVFNDNNEKVDTLPYEQTIILPGEEKKIIGSIKYDAMKYTQGEYVIRSKVLPHEGAAVIRLDSKLEVKNIRWKIWALVVLSYLSIISVIILLFSSFKKALSRI